MIKLASTIVLISCGAMAQETRLQFDWDKLAAKATEKVNVTLEGPMLRLAAQFLGNNKDEADVKKLVDGLKGIYVRSFEFDKEGQYSDADVSAIRAQLRAPEWTAIADVQGKENVGVYMKTDGKQIQGMVILAAERKEFTVVQIMGLIDPSTIGALGGSLGIPKLDLINPKPKLPPPAKK